MQGSEAWFLEEHEQPLVVQGAHPGGLVPRRIGFLVWSLVLAGVAVGLLWTPLPVPVSVGLPSAVWLMSLAGHIVAVRRHRTIRSVLTPGRAYAAVGRWRRHVRATSYEKVTDINVHQGVFGSLRGFGTVVANTAGGDLAFRHVEDPMRFRAALEEARAAYLRRLFQDRPPTRTPGAVEDAFASEETERSGRPVAVVWRGRPVGALLVAKLLPLVALALFFSVPAVGLAVAVPVAGALVVLAGVAFLAFVAWVTVAGHRKVLYTVRSDGVQVERGLFTRSLAEAGYDKVTDVSLNQDLWGKMFGYGTVVLNTAGSIGAPVHFMGVRDPESVRLLIDEARRRRG